MTASRGLRESAAAMTAEAATAASGQPRVRHPKRQHECDGHGMEVVTVKYEEEDAGIVSGVTVPTAARSRTGARARERERALKRAHEGTDGADPGGSGGGGGDEGAADSVPKRIKSSVKVGWCRCRSTPS